MFGPNVGGDRIGRFVSVAVRIDAGCGIHADVRVHVDDSGRDIFSSPIDHQRIRGSNNVRSDRRNLSIAQQYRSLLNRWTGRSHDRRIAN